MAMFIFDADTDMPSEPRDILPSFSTTKAMKQNLSKFQPPNDINLGYKTIKPISLPHNIYGLCPNTAKTASLGIFKEWQIMLASESLIEKLFGAQYSAL